MRSNLELGLQEKLRIRRGRFCGTTRFWALPVYTYIVVRCLGMNGYIGAAIILLLLAHSEGLVWPLTQTSWDVLAHLFWRGVLSLKFLVSMNGVRAV